MNNPKLCAVIFFMAIMIASISVHAQSTINPTAPDVEKNIETLGPEKTVNELNLGFKTNQKTPWDFVMDQISEGRPEWIALVPKLAPGTDGGTAEDLGIVLADALKQNPVAVFSVLNSYKGPVFDLERVCGIPFIEPTDKEVNAYFKKAKTALLNVKEPELQKLKGECLAELEKSKKQSNTGK